MRARMPRKLVAGLIVLAVAMTVGAVGAAGEDADDSAAVSEAELADATETLEPAARDLWADSFAGLWVGEDGTVNIAFTDGAASKVSALADDFPRSDLLKPVTLPVSLRDLETLQTEMGSDRELAQDGKLDLSGVPGGHYDLDIDVPGNRVVVILEDANEAATAEFEARYGKDVVVQEGPLAGPAACTRADCRYNLRSGLETIDPGESLCSTAFVVRNDQGARQILSAAHCGGGGDGDQGDARHHGGESYGDVVTQQYAGRADAERHRIQGDFIGRPWVYRNAAHEEWEINAVGTWEGLTLDEPGFCKAGVTTGEDCGKFTGKHYMPTYINNPERFLKSPNICLQPGDSGAGVYKEDNHRAQGIGSGAATNQQGEIMSCSNENYFSVHGHVEYAENALNVTVVTAPD